jgi:hypothetical protein
MHYTSFFTIVKTILPRPVPETGNTPAVLGFKNSLKKLLTFIQFIMYNIEKSGIKNYPSGEAIWTGTTRCGATWV